MSKQLLPSKPPYGDDCNGCGQCCAVQLCPVAAIAYGDDGPLPCPALVYLPEQKRTGCQLVIEEAKSGLPPRIANALGVGHGCGMED